MDFDFLPKLPQSNLDDRAFQDLVDECILRIPRYCPEWTNYNPSDPGITLIELFAWLTDQMLLRFNQVPRRHYVAFLELLGVRLQAPTPASTEVTFYLTASLPEVYTIPTGVEVATVRTETEAAIIFSTDHPLAIDSPSIQHILTAETAAPQPQMLRDRFSTTWTRRPDDEWEGPELAFFDEQPQVGNCFYLVFAPEAASEGNVIAITIKGAAATSTGINPEFPPRQWAAWNGLDWEPVLLREADDKTEGFSFSRIAHSGGNPLDGADVVLHLPQRWPVTQFVNYRGRWLRCVYTQPLGDQAGYRRSPRIVSLSARSIGGTVTATQCVTVRNEILGESDGTPGQTFQIQGAPLLPRQENEYILVTPPGGLPQRWQEVSDFSDSGPADLHYTIDALTGTVQLGPLIREPVQLREQTRLRARAQGLSTAVLFPREQEQEQQPAMERQYGAVPPRGAEVRMVAYRTGGGRRGNIQRETIRVVKSAVPYVANVTNHAPARNGNDAESLEEAVLRVPRILRTRDRAVTVEDFETLAYAAGEGAIARARCLPALSKDAAGTVRLLLVPQANTDLIERGEGINPDWLTLTPQLLEKVSTYFDERRLLGVQVLYDQPEYVGVAVQTEVALEPEYNTPLAREAIHARLEVALYNFLNPLTGGPDQTGWPFGRPVHASDITTLLQTVRGVRYLGTVQLFELRRDNSRWVRSLAKQSVVDPGSLGLLCSWREPLLRSGHIINLL